MDEPDCADFSKNITRPLGKRLGAHAHSLVEWDHECEKTDPFIPRFISSPIDDFSFSFNDMPWMKGLFVYRLRDGELELLKSSRVGNSLKWKEDSTVDGEIYLVCSSKTLAGDLVKNCLSKAKYITPEEKKVLQESYLNGRRKTPRN